jgi:hypothetical protein
MFSKRKQLEAKPLGERSLFWRQMATNGEVRAWSWSNFWRWPAIKMNYRRKHTWSHVAPVLVVGRNTWLNTWLAFRLAKDHQEVWVWDVEGLDWWNYSILSSSAFLTFCRQKLPYVPFQTIYSVLKWLRHQACESSNITILPKGYTPIEAYKDDHTKGWVLKLSRGAWPEMEGRRASESSRRFSKTQLDAGAWPDEAVRAKWPSEEVKNEDEEAASHYLLAKKVIWTSLPTKGAQVSVRQNEQYMSFAFEEQEAFGCAQQIAQTPEAFLSQPFEETNRVFVWSSENTNGR